MSLAVLLLLHCVATCLLLAPWRLLDDEPLRVVDYPVHTHRVHVYREALALGAPWGYDPAQSAGSVVDPLHDVGSKPLQVLGVVLPFLEAAAVVRLFVFMAMLTAPVWLLVACKQLGLSLVLTIWPLLLLATFQWTRTFFLTLVLGGPVAFAAATCLAPLVLVLCARFLARPGPGRYAGFVLSATALLLLHALGPLVVAPAILVMILSESALPRRWRVLALTTPAIVLALNAFWLVPLIMASLAPSPPRPFLDVLVTPRHLTWTSWSELSALLTPGWCVSRAAVLALTIYGLSELGRRAGRRVAIGFAVATAFAVLLKYAGSFVPGIALTQPIRFGISYPVLLALPVGLALAALLLRVRLPPAPIAAGAAIVLAVGTIATGNLRSFPEVPADEPLRSFVEQRTEPSDRLLVQSTDGFHLGGYEAQAFPLAFDREVIGNTFPDVHDPAQFHSVALWGRTLDEWTPEEIVHAARRWGASWCLTRTLPAKRLLAAATGGTGTKIGPYRVFRISNERSRFLVGQGEISASVNRIELRKLRPGEDGLVVLRYRFHPAWTAEEGVRIMQYTVPEDASGFIALDDPPAEVTLRFDAWAMLSIAWPEQALLAMHHVGASAHRR